MYISQRSTHTTDFSTVILMMNQELHLIWAKGKFFSFYVLCRPWQFFSPQSILYLYTSMHRILLPHLILSFCYVSRFFTKSKDESSMLSALTWNLGFNLFPHRCNMASRCFFYKYMGIVPLGFYTSNLSAVRARRCGVLDIDSEWELWEPQFEFQYRFVKSLTRKCSW